jgi:hypothetical protein
MKEHAKQNSIYSKKSLYTPMESMREAPLTKRSYYSRRDDAARESKFYITKTKESRKLKNLI